MKMPNPIDERLLAPCGLNCLLCYRHLKKAGACPGCFAEEGGEGPPRPIKSKSCRECPLKACARARGHAYCHECEARPCAPLKRLEKTYQQRYGVSLSANGFSVIQRGLDAFMRGEQEKWGCPECGGVIGVHDRLCSECGVDFSAPDGAN